MGALLEERLKPVAPVMRRGLAQAMGGQPSCAVVETSCVDGSKRRRLADQLRPTLGSLGAKQRTLRGPLRAVLFDFDATLTTLFELQAHRLFPKRGDSGAIDVAWLRDKGFGGESRILRLGATLQAIAASGAELHIVSFADRAVIVRALAILGALHFFCDRIVGWQELGGAYTSKGPFIKSLMLEKEWKRDEVLFVDDQERNVEDVRGLCLTHQTWGCGLCAEELDELRRRALGNCEHKLLGANVL